MEGQSESYYTSDHGHGDTKLFHASYSEGSNRDRRWKFSDGPCSLEQCKHNWHKKWWLHRTNIRPHCFEGYLRGWIVRNNVRNVNEVWRNSDQMVILNETSHFYTQSGIGEVQRTNMAPLQGYQRLQHTVLLPPWDQSRFLQGRIGRWRRQWHYIPKLGHHLYHHPLWFWCPFHSNCGRRRHVCRSCGAQSRLDGPHTNSSLSVSQTRRETRE